MTKKINNNNKFEGLKVVIDNHTDYYKLLGINKSIDILTVFSVINEQSMTVFIKLNKTKKTRENVYLFIKDISGEYIGRHFDGKKLNCELCNTILLKNKLYYYKSDSQKREIERLTLISDRHIPDYNEHDCYKDYFYYTVAQLQESPIISIYATKNKTPHIIQGIIAVNRGTPYIAILSIIALSVDTNPISSTTLIYKAKNIPILVDFRQIQINILFDNYNIEKMELKQSESKYIKL